jgi:hypothetical protein
MHATLIIGTTLDLSFVPSYARTPGADVFHLEIPDFGIDDARRLIDTVSRRAVGEGRVFVIRVDTMTREAQNALLKLFEEPPASVSFYLIVPHESLLIATLRSRFSDVKIGGDTRDEDGVDAFLKMAPAARLAHIGELSKEKGGARLRALGEGVIARVSTDPASYDAEVLGAATLVATHLKTRGGSRKMLLEHLALTLP